MINTILETHSNTDILTQAMRDERPRDSRLVRTIRAPAVNYQVRDVSTTNLHT